MKPTEIKDATRHLGQPKNWQLKDPPCYELPIKDELLDNLPIMVSCWQPSHEELVKLQAGFKVYLTIVGTDHPPVSIDVR